MYIDGTCPSTTAADGTVTRGPCPDAYGKVLGAHNLLNLILRPTVFRHISHLLLTRNWDVFCTITSPAANFPADGDRCDGRL
jgi:hypothetical protein